MGAKYGKFNCDNYLLPFCWALQRRTVKRAKDITDQLVDKLNTAINKHGIVGITTGKWVDLKNRHYLSLTCHFIHSNELISHCLGINQFDERATGDTNKKMY